MAIMTITTIRTNNPPCDTEKSDPPESLFSFV